MGAGPNMQRGAVTGGMLAGGVIGNDGCSGNVLGGAFLGSGLGALAGGTLDNSVDHQQGTLHGHPPAYTSAQEIRYASPPPPPLPPQAADVVPRFPDRMPS